ncbi:MAG: hypothetical protein M5R40_12055 [Anaerolineae bacterium]|nr:hypothetical protein [Anaerolineae bacterium]
MTMRTVLVPGFTLRWFSGLALFAMAVGFVFTATAQESSSGTIGTPDFAAIDRYVEDQMADCRIPGFSLGIIRGDESALPERVWSSG